MGTVMDAEKPQLVVLNGDLISGDEYQGADILDHIDRIVKPIVARRLPWASTYGNHDSNYNLSRDQMLQREKTYNGSYTQRMVVGQNAGVTNYYLPVYDGACDPTTSAATTCVPELILWFFDSRGGKYYRTYDRQPDWVDTSVVDWFTSTSKQLAELYGKAVPSLAFVHIPIHAAAVLETQGPGGHVDPRKHPGINDDKIHGQSHVWTAKDGSNSTQQQGRGGYSGHDVPFMQALVATEGLVGLFYGHDHGNTWCYRWTAGRIPGLDVEGKAGGGLHLCYGQHTGYGGYGDWVRGSREIFLSLDKLKDLVIDSHIRTELGDIINPVSLNATYGQDSYPVSPNDKTYL